jgi:hypothetical protein
MRSCTCMCHVNSQGAAWTLFKVHALLGTALGSIAAQWPRLDGVVRPRLRCSKQLCLLQCKQWSVRHSIRAAASSLFWHKFRVVSLFTVYSSQWTIPRPCLAQSPLRLGIIHGPMIDRSLSWLSVRYFSAPALPSHRQNILQARAAGTVPSAYSLRHPDTDLLSKYTPAS